MQIDTDPTESVAEFLTEASAEYYATKTRLPIVDASVNVSRSLPCFKENDIKTIIRYYSRSYPTKTMKRTEAESIIENNISIAVVHENDRKMSSFTHASGVLDGEYACKYGSSTIGQPHGSAIYFAVDFDYLPSSSVLQTHIIPYFQGINQAVKTAGNPYRIGIYGSGNTCKALINQRLVEVAWLAQSTGWGGFNEFRDSKAWALLQHPETSFCKTDVDFNEANPHVDFGGFKELSHALAEVEENTELEFLLATSAWNGLNSELKAKATILLRNCLAHGVKMVPASGLRTPLSQARLWRQSRSKTEIAEGVAKLRSKGAPWLASVLEQAHSPKGPHVTNALPGFGWHQWGEALDCYWEVDGHAVWDPDKEIDGIKGYHVYANLAEAADVGLHAGGHWSGFKDWPHVQLRAAASSADVYTYSQIDQAMKDRFGETVGVAAHVQLTKEAAPNQVTALTEAVRGALGQLMEAEKTKNEDGRNYFFPKGINLIEISLGVGTDAPTVESDATPLLSAKLIISGVSKSE